MMPNDDGEADEDVFAFFAGPENLHQAQIVTKGNRFNLAVWFSIEPPQAEPDGSGPCN